MIPSVRRSSIGSRHRSAFTLIELLVVIAIIAILAAILFPVFARARENARRAACQSNLKQISLGIMQYTQDYDEKYPLLYSMNGIAGQPGSVSPSRFGSAIQMWSGLISPYVKSTQLFLCPSSSYNDWALVDIQGDDSGFAVVGGLSYSASSHRSDSGGDGLFTDGNYGDKAAVSLSAVVKPAETIMLWDVTRQHWFGQQPNWMINSAAITGRPVSRVYDARHLEGVNCAFADGHVKWRKPSSWKVADFTATADD